MKKLLTLWFAAAILVTTSTAAKAQNVSGELSNIADSFRRAVQEQLPGWKYKSITPMEGGQDVILDRWFSGDRIVNLTIIRHQSQEEAANSIRDFAAQMKGDGKFKFVRCRG